MVGTWRRYSLSWPASPRIRPMFSRCACALTSRATSAGNAVRLSSWRAMRSTPSQSPVPWRARSSRRRAAMCRPFFSCSCPRTASASSKRRASLSISASSISAAAALRSSLRARSSHCCWRSVSRRRCAARAAISADRPGTMPASNDSSAFFKARLKRPSNSRRSESRNSWIPASRRRCSRQARARAGRPTVNAAARRATKRATTTARRPTMNRLRLISARQGGKTSST